jgi:putative transposase
MRTAYRCRAFPALEQAAVFHRTFGCVRLVWNKTLADRQAALFQLGERTSYRQTDAALTDWRKTDEHYERAQLLDMQVMPTRVRLPPQHDAFEECRVEASVVREQISADSPASSSWRLVLDSG